jgi:protein disulfide-isomerase
MLRKLTILLFLLIFSVNCDAQETKEKPNNSPKMKVEIWSDIVCPFCYIGKRNFEMALKSFEYAADVEIIWKSYQLDPEMPKKQPSKQNVYEYLAVRKGISTEQSKALHDNVVKMANAAGLNYNFDKTVVASSYDGHRLIQMAKTKNLGDAAEESLFKTYFIDGKDIAEHETLLNLGKEIGLDETAIKAMLESNQFDNEIKRDIHQSVQLGIGGVPYFIIDGRFAVSGAQPVSVFLQTLQKAYKDKR